MFEKVALNFSNRNKVIWDISDYIISKIWMCKCAGIVTTSCFYVIIYLLHLTLFDRCQVVYEL